MYTRPLGSNMAKLYWRIKKNGKWTWVPAVYDLHVDRVDEIGGANITLWWPTEEES